MKKLIGIALMLALAATLCFSSVALADDPDDVVNVNWSGSGLVGGSVTAGDDATTTFQTSGASISGSFAATDLNNNPYNYGVDNFNTNINATVVDGIIQYQTDRTDSYAPMYGSAGQLSYSEVWVIGGSGSMATGSQTNYAGMTDGTYGSQLPGGHNIVANASSYYLERYVRAGDGDNAYVWAQGDGQATLGCMSSEMSAGGVRLGRGCGCYTDANFTATGTSGLFEVRGTGTNSVSLDGMGITSGGGSLAFIANWTGSFSIGDYSLTAS